MSSLENIGSLSTPSFQMLTHFIIRSWNPTFVNITISSEKPLNLGMLSSHIMAYTSSLECQFLFEILNFIVGTKYCQLFFFQWQAHCIFETMSQIPSAEQLSFVCQLCPWVKTVFHEKKQPVLLAAQSHSAFLETTIILDSATEASGAHSLFWHWTRQGWNLMTLMFLTASSRAF